MDVPRYNIQLEELYNAICQFLRGSGKSEAHQQLLQQLGECEITEQEAKWLCLKQFIKYKPIDENSARDEYYHFNEDFTKQLCHLVCEIKPSWVTQWIFDFPEIVKEFFRGNDENIRMWFGHFNVKGFQHFKYGAKALANYSLANRVQMWSRLKWSGKHALSPVSVANKTHYFCELDIVATIQSFIQSEPDFWRSEEWRMCLEDGMLCLISIEFFSKRVYESILDGEKIYGGLKLVQRLIQETSWKQIIRRTAYYLSHDQVLLLINTIQEYIVKQQEDRDQAVSQHCRILLFGQYWKEYEDVLLANSLTLCSVELFWNIIGLEDVNNIQVPHTADQDSTYPESKSVKLACSQLQEARFKDLIKYVEQKQTVQQRIIYLGVINLLLFYQIINVRDQPDQTLQLLRDVGIYNMSYQLQSEDVFQEEVDPLILMKSSKRRKKSQSIRNEKEQGLCSVKRVLWQFDIETQQTDQRTTSLTYVEMIQEVLLQLVKRYVQLE